MGMCSPWLMYTPLTRLCDSYMLPMAALASLATGYISNRGMSLWSKCCFIFVTDFFCSFALHQFVYSSSGLRLLCGLEEVPADARGVDQGGEEDGEEDRHVPVRILSYNLFIVLENVSSPLDHFVHRVNLVLVRSEYECSAEVPVVGHHKEEGADDPGQSQDDAEQGGEAQAVPLEINVELLRFFVKIRLGNFLYSKWFNLYLE